MGIPYGYLVVDQDIGKADRMAITEAWRNAIHNGQIPVITSNARYVEFTYNRVPNAFCLYCSSPNLNSSMWCSQCGAVLLCE